jgi:hypothetical protein
MLHVEAKSETKIQMPKKVTPQTQLDAFQKAVSLQTVRRFGQMTSLLTPDAKATVSSGLTQK